MQPERDQRRVRRGRIAITAFFILLATFCITFTIGVAPALKRVQEDTESKIPHWSVEEILSADTLRLANLTTSRLVRVRGIVAPPREDSPALRAMANELGLSEEELLDRAEKARNTLAAWIFKRRVDVDFVTPPGETDDPLTGYVDVFGVDIGRKLLQGGQVMAAREDHPRRQAYLELEQTAREEAIGIWR